MHHCVLFQTGLQETVNMTCRQFSNINSSSSQVECVKLVSDLRSSACPAGRLPEMILLSDYVHFWRILKSMLEVYTCIYFVITLKQGESVISVTSIWLLQTNFNLPVILSFCSEVIDLFECEITPSGYNGCTFWMGLLLPSDSLRSKADILAL